MPPPATGLDCADEPAPDDHAGSRLPAPFPQTAWETAAAERESARPGPPRHWQRGARAHFGPGQCCFSKTPEAAALLVVRVRLSGRRETGLFRRRTGLGVRNVFALVCRFHSLSHLSFAAPRAESISLFKTKTPRLTGNRGVFGNSFISVRKCLPRCQWTTIRGAKWTFGPYRSRRTVYV
jgi:hypothetical protein